MIAVMLNALQGVERFGKGANSERAFAFETPFQGRCGVSLIVNNKD
jgi:hypothetical protein